MEKKIVAIVGSTRAEAVGPKKAEAEAACKDLGRELARRHWRIAVYTSDPDMIEPHVIAGYVEGMDAKAPPGEGDEPILCIYPADVQVRFPEEQTHPQYFRHKVDPNADWEASFYRSLAEVDGMLMVGGKNSALIAAQISLSRGLPTVAVREFGGAAATVWKSLEAKPGLIQDQDVQDMAAWGAKSAERCVASLDRQYRRKAEGDEKLAEVRDKAAKWDLAQADRKAERRRGLVAVVFLVLFLTLFIGGLVNVAVGWQYVVLSILGLCVAGGMGATVRMLGPGAPESRMLDTPILGIFVGLVFSVLYLLPQLIGDASILNPPTETATGKSLGAMRVQFISAMLVAVLAGFGFDYAFGQLLKRSKQQADDTAAGGS